MIPGKVHYRLGMALPLAYIAILQWRVGSLQRNRRSWMSLNQSTRCKLHLQQVTPPQHVQCTLEDGYSEHLHRYPYQLQSLSTFQVRFHPTMYTAYSAHFGVLDQIPLRTKPDTLELFLPEGKTSVGLVSCRRLSQIQLPLLKVRILSSLKRPLFWCDLRF